MSEGLVTLCIIFWICYLLFLFNIARLESVTKLLDLCKASIRIIYIFFMNISASDIGIFGHNKLSESF